MDVVASRPAGDRSWTTSLPRGIYFNNGDGFETLLSTSCADRMRSTKVTGDYAVR